MGISPPPPQNGIITYVKNDKYPATIPGTREFEFYKGKTLNADKKVVFDRIKTKNNI